MSTLEQPLREPSWAQTVNPLLTQRQQIMDLTLPQPQQGEQGTQTLTREPPNPPSTAQLGLNHTAQLQLLQTLLPFSFLFFFLLFFPPP